MNELTESPSPTSQQQQQPASGHKRSGSSQNGSSNKFKSHHDQSVSPIQHWSIGRPRHSQADNHDARSIVSCQDTDGHFDDDCPDNDDDDNGPKMGPVTGIFFKVWSLVKVAKLRRHRNHLRNSSAEPDTASNFEYIPGEQYPVPNCVSGASSSGDNHSMGSQQTVSNAIYINTQADSGAQVSGGSGVASCSPLRGAPHQANSSITATRNSSQNAPTTSKSHVFGHRSTVAGELPINSQVNSTSSNSSTRIGQQASNGPPSAKTKSKKKKSLVKKSATTTLNGHELATSHMNIVAQPCIQLTPLPVSSSNQLNDLNQFKFKFSTKHNNNNNNNNRQQQLISDNSKSGASKLQQQQLLAQKQRLDHELTVTNVYSVPLDSQLVGAGNARRPVVVTNQAEKLYPITKSFSTNNFFSYPHQQYQQQLIEHKPGRAKLLALQPAPLTANKATTSSVKQTTRTFASKPIIVSHHHHHGNADLPLVSQQQQLQLQLQQHQPQPAKQTGSGSGSAGSRSVLSTQSSLSTGDTSSISSSLSVGTTTNNNSDNNQHNPAQQDNARAAPSNGSKLSLSPSPSTQTPEMATSVDSISINNNNSSDNSSDVRHHGRATPLQIKSGIHYHGGPQRGSPFGPAGVAGQHSNRPEIFFQNPLLMPAIAPPPGTNYADQCSSALINAGHYPASQAHRPASLMLTGNTASHTHHQLINQQQVVNCCSPATNLPPPGGAMRVMRQSCSYHDQLALAGHHHHQAAANSFYSQQQQQQAHLFSSQQPHQSFQQSPGQDSAAYILNNYYNSHHYMGSPGSFHAEPPLPASYHHELSSVDETASGQFDGSFYASPLSAYPRHYDNGNAAPAAIFPVNAYLHQQHHNPYQQQQHQTVSGQPMASMMLSSIQRQFPSSSSSHDLMRRPRHNDATSFKQSRQPFKMSSSASMNSFQSAPTGSGQHPSDVMCSREAPTASVAPLHRARPEQASHGHTSDHNDRATFVGELILNDQFFFNDPYLELVRPLLPVEMPSLNVGPLKSASCDTDSTSNDNNYDDLDAGDPDDPASCVWPHQQQIKFYVDTQIQQLPDSPLLLQPTPTGTGSGLFDQSADAAGVKSRPVGMSATQARKDRLAQQSRRALENETDAALLRCKRRPRHSRKLYKMLKCLVRYDEQAALATSHQRAPVSHHVVISGPTGSGKTLFVANLVANSLRFRQFLQQQQQQQFRQTGSSELASSQWSRQQQFRLRQTASEAARQGTASLGYLTQQQLEQSTCSLKDEYQINKAENILCRQLLAYHYCQVHNYSTKNTADFIQNLIHQIATSGHVGAYRELLSADTEPAAHLRRLLSRSSCLKNPVRAVRDGLLVPLHTLWQQGKISLPRPGLPLIIVIDALDEACRSVACPNHPQPFDGPTRLDTGSCQSSACSDDDTFATPPANDLKHSMSLADSGAGGAGNNAPALAAAAGHGPLTADNNANSGSNNKFHTSTSHTATFFSKCDNPIGDLLMKIIGLFPSWIKFVITVNSSHLCFRNSHSTPLGDYIMQCKQSAGNNHNNNASGDARTVIVWKQLSLDVNHSAGPGPASASGPHKRPSESQQDSAVSFGRSFDDALDVKSFYRSLSNELHGDAASMAPPTGPTLPKPACKDLDLLAYIHGRTKLWSPSLFERVSGLNADPTAGAAPAKPDSNQQVASGDEPTFEQTNKRSQVSPRRRAIATVINYLACYAHGSFFYCDLLLDLIEAKKLEFDLSSDQAAAAASGSNIQTGSGSNIQTGSGSNATSECEAARAIVLRLNKQFAHSISRSGWQYLMGGHCGGASVASRDVALMKKSQQQLKKSDLQASLLKQLELPNNLRLEQLFYLYIEYKFPHIRSKSFSDQATNILQILMSATCTCTSTNLNQLDLFMVLNAAAPSTQSAPSLDPVISGSGNTGTASTPPTSATANSSSATAAAASARQQKSATGSGPVTNSALSGEIIKRWKAFEKTLNELTCAYLLKVQRAAPAQSDSTALASGCGSSRADFEHLTKDLSLMFRHDFIRQWLSNCHLSLTTGWPGSALTGWAPFADNNGVTATSSRPSIVINSHRFNIDATYGHYCLAKWLLLPEYSTNNQLSDLPPAGSCEIADRKSHESADRKSHDSADRKSHDSADRKSQHVNSSSGADCTSEPNNKSSQLCQGMDPSLVRMLLQRRHSINQSSANNYVSGGSGNGDPSQQQQQQPQPRCLSPANCLQIAAHAVHCFASSCRRRRSSSTTSFNWTLFGPNSLLTGNAQAMQDGSLQDSLAMMKQQTGAGAQQQSNNRSIDSGISQMAATNTNDNTMMSGAHLVREGTSDSLSSPTLLSATATSQQQSPAGEQQQLVFNFNDELLFAQSCLQNRRRSSAAIAVQQQHTPPATGGSASASNSASGGGPNNNSALDPLASPWFDELLGILCDQEEALLSSALSLPVNLFDAQLEASRLLLSAGANANVSVPVDMLLPLPQPNNRFQDRAARKSGPRHQSRDCPLIVMMSKRNDLEFVKLLLQFQADPDACIVSPYLSSADQSGSAAAQQTARTAAKSGAGKPALELREDAQHRHLLLSSPSVIAAHEGHTEILKLLVEHGASDRITPRQIKMLRQCCSPLDDKLIEHYHPLLVASCFNRLKIVEYLTDHLYYVYCVSINSGHQEEFFVDLLHQSMVIACIRGHYQIYDALMRFLRYFIKQSSSATKPDLMSVINRCDRRFTGHTPLTGAASAATNNNLDICRSLIEDFHASHHVLNAFNQTALSCFLASLHLPAGSHDKLAHESDLLDTVQLLLKGASSASSGSSTGTSGKHAQQQTDHATNDSNIPMLINNQDKPFGFSALIHAARVLPATSGDPNKSASGDNAADNCGKHLHADSKQLSAGSTSTEDDSSDETDQMRTTNGNGQDRDNLSSKVTKILIGHGANVNTTDIQGSSALMHAIQCDNYKSVQYILDSRDAELNVRNELDMSALDYACLRGSRLKMLKMLVDSGANFEHKDKNGLRLLDRVIAQYCAASQDNMILIEYLLQNGAKLGSKTWECANGKLVILDALLKKLCQDGYYLYKKLQLDAAVYRFEYALKRLALIEHGQPPFCRPFNERNMMRTHYSNDYQQQVFDDTILESMQQTKYQLYLGLSRCERKRKNYMKALEDAHMTILIESSSYEGYFSKAQILKDLGEYHEALVAIEQASNLIDKTINEIMNELNQNIPGYNAGHNGNHSRSLCETQMTENAEYLMQARKYVHNLKAEIISSTRRSSNVVIRDNKAGLAHQKVQ